MKRNGAQAGEGKPESRFAALTSGLLARKGQAAPSNSPIHDPAEETDAFALEPTRKQSKTTAAPAPTTRPATAEAKKPAPVAPPPKKVEASLAAPKAMPAAEAKPGHVKASAPIPTLKVINERSADAGYPDNPSPEEIAAIEAEADEVVSYFENFGSDDAVKQEKVSFYGGAADAEEDENDADADPDPLDDLEDDPPAPGPGAGPWAAPSVPTVGASGPEPVRAGVTVQLTAREFMRLSLGAAELNQPAQELIVEAIEDYLDARGVESLGGCACIQKVSGFDGKTPQRGD
jgi:hypothetical protein